MRGQVRVKISHASLVKSVLEAIKVTECAFCWKMQSGLFKDWRGKPVGHIGRPGVPDICGITKNGKFLGIEVKVGADKQRPSQIEFERVCTRTGAHYYVVDEKTNLTDFVKLVSKI